MSVKYKLLHDYKGFAKGQIITVAGRHRFEDMKRGYGEPYIEPEPEVEKKAHPKAKPKSKPETKTEPKPKPKTESPKRDSKGHFITTNKQNKGAK